MKKVVNDLIAGLKDAIAYTQGNNSRAVMSEYRLSNKKRKKVNYKSHELGG